MKWKSLSHVWLFVTPWTIYSPWNSPGQNTGVVASLSSRGSSQLGQIQVSHIAGGFFTSWATREAQDTGVGSLSLLQRIFPTQELELGSHALQADSLPTELSGKRGLNTHTHTHTHKLWFTVYRAELMNLHWFNSNSKMITYFPPRGNSLGKRHTSTPQVPEGCKLVSRHHMHKHMFFVWTTNTVKI